MKKNHMSKLVMLATALILATGLSAMALTGQVSAKGPRGNGSSTGGYGGNMGCSTTQTCMGGASTPLSDAEKEGLNQAILEEYGALNLYKSVIQLFGEVAPFSQIVLAEQQHVNSLIKQAVKYGVAVPADPGVDASISFDTLNLACSAGVQAETEDAALYDGLMTATSHTDLLRVYSALQSASLNNHLPAFLACE